jgi:hypothetical protein
MSFQTIGSTEEARVGGARGFKGFLVGLAGLGGALAGLVSALGFLRIDGCAISSSK